VGCPLSLVEKFAQCSLSVGGCSSTTSASKRQLVVRAKKAIGRHAPRQAVAVAIARPTVPEWPVGFLRATRPSAFLTWHFFVLPHGSARL
jgi:hypothetical protein